MPKAAANLYGYTHFPEYDIDLPSQIRKGPLTHPIAETTREKLSA